MQQCGGSKGRKQSRDVEELHFEMSEKKRGKSGESVVTSGWSGGDLG